MKISPELVKAIEYGDALDDEQLETALTFYQDLHESLSCLGKEYRIIYDRVHREVLRLEEFKHAREEKSRGSRTLRIQV